MLPHPLHPHFLDIQGLQGGITLLSWVCDCVLKLVSSLCLNKCHQHTRYFDPKGPSAKYSKYCEYPSG